MAVHVCILNSIMLNLIYDNAYFKIVAMRLEAVESYKFTKSMTREKQACLLFLIVSTKVFDMECMVSFILVKCIHDRTN